MGNTTRSRVKAFAHRKKVMVLQQQDLLSGWCWQRRNQVHSLVPKFKCSVNSYLPFKAVTNVVIVVASFSCTQQLYVCMMAGLLLSHTGRTDPYFMSLGEVREGISIWETPP